MGRLKSTFAMYQSTEYSRTPDGKMYSIPYLLASKHYKQVIDNSQEFKELMRKQQDTINAQYMNVLERKCKPIWGWETIRKRQFCKELL